MEDVFRHLVSEKKLINDENPSIEIFNIDFFKERLESLKKAFPEDFFLHAMALKGDIFNCSFSSLHPICNADLKVLIGFRP